MSEGATSGIIEMTTKCLCSPPNVLSVGRDCQRARCDTCGVELLVGVVTGGPRLELVRPENGHTRSET